MDEKYIEFLYNNLGGSEQFGTLSEFSTGLSTDGDFRRAFYAEYGNELDPYDDFEGKVKKKETGLSDSGVPAGASMAGSRQESIALSASVVPGLGNSLSPSVWLNRRQLGDFAGQGGFVASPQKQRELVEGILAKPVSEEQRDVDRLIDFVADGLGQIRVKEFERQQKLIKESGEQFTDEQQGYDEVSKRADKSIVDMGYGDAVSFVNNALKNKDYASIRQVINNSYGKQADEVKNKYTVDPNEELAAVSVAKFLGWDGVLDQADVEIAPLQKEKDRVNAVIDRVASQDYVVNNPTIQEDYKFDVVGGKPINAELSPNQYSGLRFMKDNYPEAYKNYELELSKAANPELFGNSKYNKGNADYQQMMYDLDKRGNMINTIAMVEQAKLLDSQKVQVDENYRTRINQLTAQMNSATDYDQRRVLQEQINSTLSEYNTNPVITEYNKLGQDYRSNQVNFAQKYPDQASRDREYMVRDILNGNGKGIMEEVGDRVKWLFSNTVSGLGNISGISELFLGGSRNYLRDLRMAEEERSEQYQPSMQAAQQSLYKLNFTDQDFRTISAIKNSENLDDKQKADHIAQYIDNNADRIRYVDNPEAGKHNWTPGAIGNQVADVSTQVLYQAALTYLTARAGSALAGAGNAARGAALAEGAAAAEAAAYEGAAMEGAGALSAAAQRGLAAPTSAIAQTGLRAKLGELASIMGSTYATTYQPAYAQALADGKSTEDAAIYAHEISFVNALTETINPDIAVLRNTFKGMRGLSRTLSGENLGLLSKVKGAAGIVGRQWLKTTSSETLEEVAAAYGEYGVDKLNDLNQDDMNSLSNRVQQAVITTAIGMTPMGLIGGGRTALHNNQFLREQFYQAGLYPSETAAVANQLVDQGDITQQEADRRIQVANTMSNVINNLPTLNNGMQMPVNAQMEYAYNEMQRRFHSQELDNTTDQHRRQQLTKRIDELATRNDAILNMDQQAPAVPPASTSTQEQPAPAPVPGAQPSQQEEGRSQTAPERVAPATTFQEGDVLESDQGDFTVRSVNANGEYQVSTPDGRTESFTQQEISDLVRPRRVRTAAENAQQAPAAQPVPTGTQEQPAPATETAPQAQENFDPLIYFDETEQAPAPVQEAAPSSVNVQLPGTQTAAPTVTIGSQQEGAPPTETTSQAPAEPIVSPSNTDENATDQVNQQRSVGEELRQGTSIGEAAQSSSSDSLLGTENSQSERSQTGEVSQAGQQEAQINATPTEAPAASNTEVAPGAVAPTEQSSGQQQEDEAEFSMSEAAALTPTQEATVRRMPKERLYDNIIAINPNSPVRDRSAEYSRAELENIYRGELARQATDEAEQNAAASQATPEGTQPTPAQTTPSRQSELSEAIMAENEARRLVEKKRADLEAVKNRNSPEYARQRAMLDRANQRLREAENARIKALKNDISKQRRAKRNMGIMFSPEANAQRDVQIIQNYIELAKIYLRRGVRTLEEFAARLNESVNPHMRQAWAITQQTDVPLQGQQESYKEYLQRLRVWENEQAQVAAEQGLQERGEQVREAAEQMRLGVRKMKEGIGILRANINMTLQEFNARLGLDPSDYTTYVAALKWNIENNPIKKRTAKLALDNIRQANPKKVVATEMQLLRMRLGAQEQGARAAVQQLRQVRKQVFQMLSDLHQSGLLNSGNFQQRDLIAMGKQVNSIYNEKGLDQFSDFMQTLIDNSSNARTLGEVRDLQARLGRLMRSKDVITANLMKKGQIGSRSVLDALRRVNPLSVPSLLQLNGMLDNVVGALSGTKPLEVSAQQIKDFLEQQQSAQVIRAADRLRERYNQTEALLDTNIGAPTQVNEAWTNQQFNEEIDSILNNNNLDMQGRQDAINTLYDAVLAFEHGIREGGGLVSFQDTYDQVRDGTDATAGKRVQRNLVPAVQVGQEYMRMALEAPDFNANEQQRGWVQSIANLELDRLSNKQLSLVNNVIDNILVNNDFSGAQALDVLRKSQVKMNNFTEWFQRTNPRFSKSVFGSYLGQAARSISSTDQVVATIANNSRDFLTRLMDVSGLGDLKSFHAQAKQQFERELSKPLMELYKKNKGLRDPRSIIKRSMYAYLNETNFGNRNDRQGEFDRRKAILEQDFQLKQTGGQEAIDEAVVLREVFDEHFRGIQNVEQLRSAKILTEPEAAVYNLFRDFYDRHQADFASVMQNMLNKPFEEVENYVKDSYKMLDTNKADANYHNLAGSAFFNEANPNAATTSMLQRNQFYNLYQIGVPNELGTEIQSRVINHAFDTTQLNNAMAMLEDIHTLGTRLEASYMLSDPRIKEALGVENVSLLRKNTENQARAQQKLLSRPEQSVIDDWSERFGNAANKIAVRQALFAVGQLLKQPADIIFNTSTNLGADAGMFFQAMSKMITDNSRMNELLGSQEIGLRGHTFGGTNWFSQAALNQLRQTMDRMGESAELNRQDRLASLLEAPDTFAAKAAWLSYYAQSLKRQGLSKGFSDIDWNEQLKNINREARDYAQVMTSTRLNVNSKESQSEFYSKASGLGRVFRLTFLPLSSFNMNNYSLMYRDMTTLFAGDSTREQKLTAFRSIGSRVVAEAAFQATRAGWTMLLKGAAGGLMGLMGVEPPKKAKEDKDFWFKLYSEVIKNLAFGMAGNISQEWITGKINWISDKLGGDQLLHQYPDNPNSPNTSLGVFSMLKNSYDNGASYLRDLFYPMDKDGNPVEVTDAEKAIIGTAFLMNIASAFGFMEADTRRVFDEAAHRIERNKPYKDPYYRLENDPNEKPNIKINGKSVQWSEGGDELDYYREQRQYHLQMLEELNWSEDRKKREATERAKVDLKRRYGRELKYSD